LFLYTFNNFTRRVAAATVAVALAAGQVGACVPGTTLLQYLQDPQAPTNSFLGFSVAMMGSDIVAGSPFGFIGNGKAALYSGKTGLKLKEYSNPSADLDGFGRVVTVVGSDVYVSAPYGDTPVSNSGAVHAYVGKTGAFKFTLSNPTPNIDDQFGAAVAASPAHVFVAAPSDDADGASAGIVHVYTKKGEFVASIHNPQVTSTSFGSSLAVVGKYLYVGAPGGTPRVFRFDLKTRAQVGQPLTGAMTSQFGHAMATTGKALVVGAPGAAAGVGEAHLFNAEGTLLQKLVNFFPSSGAQFGQAVAISSKRILVGAAGVDTATGRAFEYSASGQFLGVIDNPFPDTNDNFGYSVALDKTNRVLISAPGEDIMGTNTGIVYTIQGY